MARKFEIGVVIKGEDRLSPVVKKSESSIKRWGSSIAETALRATAAVATVVAAFRGLEEAGARLGQRNALGRNLEKQGQDLDAFLEKLNEVSRGTIATADLIASSSQALLLGIPADKIAKLLEVARASAIATGTSTAKAFDDIATGIGRASPLILDNLGIVVKLEQVYKDAAVGLNKTAEEMTAVEKKTALLNSVLEVGQERIRTFGEEASKTGENMAILSAAFENGKNAAFEFAVNGVAELGTRLGEFRLQLDGTAQATEDSAVALGALTERAIRTGKSIAEVRGEIEKGKRATASAIPVWLEHAQVLDTNTSTISRLIGGLNSAAEATDILTKADRRRLRIEQDIAKSSEGFADAIEALGVTLSTEVNEAIEENNKLLEQAEDLYKLGALSAEDYERVQRGVAAANRDARDSLLEAVTGYERVGIATAGATVEQRLYNEELGISVPRIRQVTEALEGQARAANSITGGTSDFSQVGGGTFTTVSALPEVDGSGRVIVPGVGRPIANPNFVRIA